VISAWLDLPVAGVFAVLLVVYGLTAAAIVWITFWSPLSAAIRTCTGLSASFFASVSVLFALLTGFLAGDVVDRNKQATRAVEAETGALASLHALTLVAPADMATISEALRSYVDAIVNDEWNAMADGRPSPKTNTALTELLRTVADPKIAPAATQSVRDGLINLSLRAAAETRL